MPKARRTNYKKKTTHRNVATTRSSATQHDRTVTAENHVGTAETTRASRRVEQVSRASSYQSLVMPGMVTLGCLGLAISFTFFTADPNRFLYGGIAALMTLMWAFSFWMRLRKVLRK